VALLITALAKIGGIGLATQDVQFRDDIYNRDGFWVRYAW
jgi:hypothetical protein